MEKNSLRKWGQAQGTVGGFRLLVTCSSEEVGLGDIPYRSGYSCKTLSQNLDLVLS